jgi:hypothetical protein
MLELVVADGMESTLMNGASSDTGMVGAVNLVSGLDDSSSKAAEGNSSSRQITPKILGAPAFRLTTATKNLGRVDGDKTLMTKVYPSSPALRNAPEANKPERTEVFESENKLTVRITTLWSDQAKKNSSLKCSRSELIRVREELGEHLHALKSLFATSGRNSRWAGFLREAGIPLASADRYVARHRKSLEPAPVNLLNDEVSTPSPEEVTALVKKLTPKLTSFLTTQTSVAQFMQELAAALNAVQRTG